MSDYRSILDYRGAWLARFHCMHMHNTCPSTVAGCKQVAFVIYCINKFDCQI